MTYITTVSTKGQVTLPHHVRQRLGIKVGDRAMVSTFHPQKKQITLEIVGSDQDIIEELAGSLATNKPYMDMETVRHIAGKKLAQKYGVRIRK